MLRIADPVLKSLSKNELKRVMPVEARKSTGADRRHYTYLQAFARLHTGMSPWPGPERENNAEGNLKEKYVELASEHLHNATYPASPYFMNFDKDGWLQIGVVRHRP